MSGVAVNLATLVLTAVGTVLLVFITWRMSQMRGGQTATAGVVEVVATRSEAAVRDEFARSRIEAGEASCSLREEVGRPPRAEEGGRRDRSEAAEGTVEANLGHSRPKVSII